MSRNISRHHHDHKTGTQAEITCEGTFPDPEILSQTGNAIDRFNLKIIHQTEKNVISPDKKRIGHRTSFRYIKAEEPPCAIGTVA
ncbi:hypothetical protein LOC54_02720 [Acetobacter sp. AN02]|uniref:hypothetical protein n=1 Tax=Acetobacter sp. AN02 TaxID=2894186 RepID=UPI0024345181|nr:hypothetical protein [Acetobacter sp. AN02]MDG6094036.1 hypothetical protein [Acetobacter sp. AN02]